MLFSTPSAPSGSAPLLERYLSLIAQAEASALRGFAPPPPGIADGLDRLANPSPELQAWIQGQLPAPSLGLDPLTLLGLLFEQLSRAMSPTPGALCQGQLGGGDTWGQVRRSSWGATNPPTATPSAATPSANQGRLDGMRVQVFGDSLMVGAQTATRRALLDAGASQVAIDAIGGRALSQSGSGKNLSPNEIRQQVQASGANVVVLELGSNHADYARLVPETMQALSTLRPPPKVVWVNTQTQKPAKSAYGDRYFQENARINQVIQEAAARYPNLEVADWSALAGRPGINGGDGLHLTGRGNEVMAQLILESLRS
ncbi:MAG: hypothetical protein IPG45_13400 [Deltaproteobacteria bacterium]|jgi:lysophospholipase L1-like esterase|nr:hypothetical protein [Deltaproteobacteria bacterium]